MAGAAEEPHMRVALVDIDGTVADSLSHMNLWWDGGWDTFHSTVDQMQPLNNDVKRILELLELPVIFWTCRPDKHFAETENWLKRHGFEFGRLMMRPPGQPSGLFKVSALARLRREGFEPVIAFEDDPETVERLRADGLPTVYIHSGCYEAHQPWRIKHD